MCATVYPSEPKSSGVDGVRNETSRSTEMTRSSEGTRTPHVLERLLSGFISSFPTEKQVKVKLKIISSLMFSNRSPL